MIGFTKIRIDKKTITVLRHPNRQSLNFLQSLFCAGKKIFLCLGILAGVSFTLDVSAQVIDNFESGEFASGVTNTATPAWSPAWSITDADPISGVYSAKAPADFFSFSAAESALEYKIVVAEAGLLSFDIRGPIREKAFLEILVNGEVRHRLTETDDSIRSLNVILPAGTSAVAFLARQTGVVYDNSTGDYIPNELTLDNLSFEEGAPPVAVLPNYFRTGADETGSGSVDLDASASYDVGGIISDYSWTWDGGAASGATAQATFPEGETTVQLTLTDDDGDQTSVDVTVFVLPQGNFSDSFEDGVLDPMHWETSAEEEGYEWIITNRSGDAIVTDGSLAAFSSLRYRNRVYRADLDLYVNAAVASELWFDLGLYMYSPEVHTNNITVYVDGEEWKKWPENDESFNFKYEERDIRIPLTAGFHKVSWVHNNSDGTSSRAAQEVSIDNIRQTEGIKPTIVFELESFYFDDDGDSIFPITLDGSDTADLDGSITLHEWDINGEVLTGPVHNIDLPVGKHQIAYRATDNDDFVTEKLWNVIVYPGQLNDGFETGDLTGAVWEIVDGSDWRVVDGEGIEGSFALQPPLDLNPGETASILLHLSGPGLGFASKQPLGSTNELRIYRDGSLQSYDFSSPQIPATGQWFYHGITVNTRQTEVRFEYTQVDSETPGALFLDALVEPSSIRPFVDYTGSTFAGDLNGNGSETIQLDASESRSNVRGGTEELTFTWEWEGGSATGVSPEMTFPIGETLVTLTAFDEEGNARSAAFPVSIGAYGASEELLNAFVHSGLDPIYISGMEAGSDYIFATSGQSGYLELPLSGDKSITLVTNANPDSISNSISFYIDGVEVDYLSKDFSSNRYTLIYPFQNGATRVGIRLSSQRRLYSIEIGDDAGVSFDFETYFPNSGEVIGAGFYSIFETDPVTVEAVPAEGFYFDSWQDSSDSFWRNYDINSAGPFDITPTESLSGKALILPEDETVAMALDLPADSARYDESIIGISNESFEGDHSVLAESLFIRGQSDPGDYLLFWTKGVSPGVEGDGFVITENWTRNVMRFSFRSRLLEPEYLFGVDHPRFLVDSVQFYDDLVSVYFCENFFQGDSVHHAAGASAYFYSTNGPGTLTGPDFDYTDGVGVFHFDNVEDLQSSFGTEGYALTGFDVALPTAAFPSDIPTPDVNGSFNLYDPDSGYPENISWQPWNSAPQGSVIRVSLVDVDGNDLGDVMIGAEATTYPLPDEDCYIGISFLVPVEQVRAAENEKNPGVITETYVGKTTFIRSFKRPRTFAEWQARHEALDLVPSDILEGDSITIGDKYRLGLSPSQSLDVIGEFRKPGLFSDPEWFMSFDIAEETTDWMLQESEDLLNWRTLQESGPRNVDLQFDWVQEDLLRFETFVGFDDKSFKKFYRLQPKAQYGTITGLGSPLVTRGGAVALYFDTLSQDMMERTVFSVGGMHAPVVSFDVGTKEVVVQVANDPGTYEVSYLDDLGTHSTGQFLEVLAPPLEPDVDGRFNDFISRLDQMVQSFEATWSSEIITDIESDEKVAVSDANIFFNEIRDLLVEEFSNLDENQKQEYFEYVGDLERLFYSEELAPPFDLDLPDNSEKQIRSGFVFGKSSLLNENCIGGADQYIWEPNARAVWQRRTLIAANKILTNKVLAQTSNTLQLIPPAKATQKVIGITSKLIEATTIYLNVYPIKLEATGYLFTPPEPFFREHDCAFIDFYFGDFRIPEQSLEEWFWTYAQTVNEYVLDTEILPQLLNPDSLRDRATSAFVNSYLTPFVYKNGRKIYDSLQTDRLKTVIEALKHKTLHDVSFRPFSRDKDQAPENAITFTPKPMDPIPNVLNGEAVYDRETWKITPVKPGKVVIPLEVVDHMFKEDTIEPDLDFDLEFDIYNRAPSIISIPSEILIDPVTFEAEVPIEVAEFEDDELYYRIFEAATNFEIEVDLDSDPQMLRLTPAEIKRLIVEDREVHVPQTNASYPIQLSVTSLAIEGEPFTVQFLDEVMVEEEELAGIPGPDGRYPYPYTIEPEKAEQTITIRLDDEANSVLQFGIEEQPLHGEVTLSDTIGESTVANFTPNESFLSAQSDRFVFWVIEPAYPDLKVLGTVTLRAAEDPMGPTVVWSPDAEIDIDGETVPLFRVYETEFSVDFRVDDDLANDSILIEEGLQADIPTTEDLRWDSILSPPNELTRSAPLEHIDTVRDLNDPENWLQTYTLWMRDLAGNVTREVFAVEYNYVVPFTFPDPDSVVFEDSGTWDYSLPEHPVWSGSGYDPGLAVRFNNDASRTPNGTIYANTYSVFFRNGNGSEESWLELTWLDAFYEPVLTFGGPINWFIDRGYGAKYILERTEEVEFLRVRITDVPTF